MSHLPTTRRSASHGALDKSYSAHALHAHRRSFLRHPLRSVNENVSLLASPGPLESMLKITTETGDIGLFSIKPVRSSGSIRGTSCRRPSFGDGVYGRPQINDHRLQGSSNLRDDRRWLPSYRDAASEIISMYGSDSMRSAASSSLTLPLDDRGHRSYSMTTCSSRPMPQQNSSGTMQSDPSDGLLQRPRSPFPYPTRLKRPGVRPSSPALTESGAVDYSRMVAIDRVSRRTVHGSYKPTYPQHNGRPLPRACFDGNRSSEYSSGYNMSPVSPTTRGNKYRSKLNSSASEHSLRTSSLTSIVNMYQRSTCGPPSQKASVRAQSPGAFYYDYSEGFGYTSDDLSPVLDFNPHISPRSRSLCQQRVEAPIRSRGSSRYDAAPTPGPSAGYERYTPQSSIAESEHHDEAADEGETERHTGDGSEPQRLRQRPSTLLSSDGADDERLPPSCTERSNASIILGHDGEVWSLGAEAVHKRQNSNLAVKGSLHMSSHGPISMTSCTSCKENMPYLPPFPAHSSPRPENLHRFLPASYRGHGSNSSVQDGRGCLSRFYSVESGLSDFSSPVEFIDKTAKPTSQQGSVSSTSPPSRSRQTSPGSAGHIQDENGIWQVPLAEEGWFSQVEQEHSYASGDVSGFRGHKRNLAVPRIHIGNLLTTPETDLDLILDRSRTPMLAPHPISPARQLRLQNSVPQLMKALPRLPNAPLKIEPFIGNNSSDEFECAMRFTPIDPSTIKIPKPIWNDKEAPGENRKSPGGIYDDQRHTVDHAVTNTTEALAPNPRVISHHKLTLPFELCALNAVPGKGTFQTENAPHREPRTNWPGNGKLKLKVSRGALTRIHGETGRLRRNTVSGPAKGCSDVASDPDLWTRISLDGCIPSLARRDSNIESRLENERNKMFSVISAFVGTPVPSTPVPSLVLHHSGQDARVDGAASLVAREPTGAMSPISIADARSSFSVDSCVSDKSARGLQKRISNLRGRLAEPRVRSAEVLNRCNGLDEALQSEAVGCARPSTTKLAKIKTVEAGGDEGRFGNGISDVGHGDVDVAQHQGRGFRGRMSKWMKSARQSIMVACGRSEKRG